MNEVSTIERGGSVAVQNGYDPFAAYGQEAANGGTFLKFNKGEWQAGQNSDEVPLGTLLVANMQELSIGWIRWENGSPAERRLNLLTSGVKPERRDELGYDDQTEWETNDDGDPQDPWNFTNELPMADPKTGTQYTFSASSKGSIGCIGNVCKTYARLYKDKPGLVPVMELKRDSYIHRKHGKLYVPVLEIVDWVENGSVPDAPAKEEDPQEEKPAAAKTTAGSKARF